MGEGGKEEPGLGDSSPDDQMFELDGDEDSEEGYEEGGDQGLDGPMYDSVESSELCACGEDNVDRPWELAMDRCELRLKR
jgi:hypothetical protein